MLRRDGSAESVRALVTVKTYPTPSKKYMETVCTAGITEDGEFIRLYPVPFRLMAGERQFRKYDWVEVQARRKLKDPRPESYALDEETLQIQGHIDAARGWARRRALVLPLVSQSVEDLMDRQASTGQSLGIIRPAEVTRFTMRRTTDDWTDAELTKLTQEDLFRHAPRWTLDKLPWEFRYEFRCDDPRCNGHKFQVFDWEMGQSYRKWSGKYGLDWPNAMQEKYMRDLAETRDLYFFLGTIARHPKSWTIVGLFYPPRAGDASEVDGRARTAGRKGVREDGTVTQLGLPFEAEEAHALAR
jgi:hypothetical protein